MGIWGSHGGTIIYIQVRVLNIGKRMGKRYPLSASRRKVQGRWEDVVHPSQELRERIAEVVNREIRKRNHKRLGTSRNRSSEYEPVSGAAQKDSKHRRDCNGRSVWSDNQRSHCETGTGWTFFVTCPSITVRKKDTGM